MGILTVSGNEITDVNRRAALLWGTSQQAGSVDQYPAPDGSIGIWASATNFFQRGQNDATGAYASAHDAGAATVFATDATVPAPFSPQSVKLTVDGGGSTQGGQAQTATGLAMAVGASASASIWMKGTAGQPYRCTTGIVNTDASTTFGTDLIFNATGAWQLVTPASIVVAAGKTGDRIVVRIQTDSARAESFWAAHPMLEKNAYSTPYVATSGGSTALRSNARVQAPASLLSSAQGWIAAYLRMGWSSTAPFGNRTTFSLDDGTTNNRIELFWNVASLRWELRREAGGVVGNTTFVADAFNAGDSRTLILSWDGVNASISVNGAAFVSTANNNQPVVTTFNIGCAATASNIIDSDVFWVACGKGTLTNIDAATINGWGSTSPTIDSFATTAQATMVASGAQFPGYIDYSLIPIIGVRSASH